MAVRADGRLSDPQLQSFAVHAGEKLLGNVGVAHAAGLGHLLAERLGVGRGQFVSASVADGAIRGRGISSLQRQSVDALRMLAHLCRVATAAGGFWDAFRMGVRVMVQVAVGAPHRCMGRSAKLLALVVATGAGVVVLRLAEGRQYAHHGAQDRKDQESASAQKSPAKHHCKTS